MPNSPSNIVHAHTQALRLRRIRLPYSQSTALCHAACVPPSSGARRRAKRCRLGQPTLISQPSVSPCSPLSRLASHYRRPACHAGCVRSRTRAAPIVPRLRGYAPGLLRPLRGHVPCVLLRRMHVPRQSLRFSGAPPGSREHADHVVGRRRTDALRLGRLAPTYPPPHIVCRRLSTHPERRNTRVLQT